MFQRYKEQISYLFWGVLTTLVGFGSYYVFVNHCHWHYALSNALSLALAILFAYFTNKTWVFNSPYRGLAHTLRELSTFTTLRLFSSLLDMGAILLFVGYLGYNENWSKLIVAFAVVVLNYVFSKLIAFKK